MAEMRIMGSRAVLDREIPQETRDALNFEVRGGDTHMIWNPRDEDERKHAEKTFKDLTKKGFSAFRVDSEGEQSKRMDSFDPEAGKMILVPRMAGGA